MNRLLSMRWLGFCLLCVTGICYYGYRVSSPKPDLEWNFTGIPAMLATQESAVLLKPGFTEEKKSWIVTSVINLNVRLQSLVVGFGILLAEAEEDMSQPGFDRLEVRENERLETGEEVSANGFGESMVSFIILRIIYVILALIFGFTVGRTLGTLYFSCKNRSSG